jgi:ubiquinone/menaquinone biosynthesis C-methylase UbiE
MTSDSPDSPDTLLSGIWTGVAGSYDVYRPRTPPVLLELLPQLAGIDRPRLVVDLGSGTGLSTYAWSGHAERVIGIEPNADMRRRAEAKRGIETNVRFIEGVGHVTGLPDASADLVTASQALHWMDPQPTFAEITRILRPGGVFAAYDYDWPVIITPETDLLYAEFMARLDSLVAGHDDDFGRGAGDHKEEHLARMRESGQFRLTREISVHSEEQGDADRFIGLMLSNSGSILIERGVVTDEQLDLEAFRARARALLGDAPRRWYFSYRVRYGVK